VVNGRIAQQIVVEGTQVVAGAGRSVVFVGALLRGLEVVLDGALDLEFLTLGYRRHASVKVGPGNCRVVYPAVDGPGQVGSGTDLFLCSLRNEVLLPLSLAVGPLHGSSGRLLDDLARLVHVVLAWSKSASVVSEPGNLGHEDAFD